MDNIEILLRNFGLTGKFNGHSREYHKELLEIIRLQKQTIRSCLEEAYKQNSEDLLNLRKNIIQKCECGLEKVDHIAHRSNRWEMIDG